MNFSLTTDEKRFLFNKYKNTSYKDLKKDELKWGNSEDGWGETDVFHLTQKEFIEKIKTDAKFSAKWGELGEGTYGGMWRDFPYGIDICEYDGLGYPKNHAIEDCIQIRGVDQLQNVIDKLKTNPDDRRLIVSAWHPHWINHCALPPCHCLFQFHTEELTPFERSKIYYNDEAYRKHRSKAGIMLPASEKDFNEVGVPTRRLNCQLYQRSCDTFLGVPFNIASYSLLTCMLAQVSNMAPGEFVHTYGDLHIYKNHLTQVGIQLSRTPFKLPTLKLNPNVKSLFDFKYEDIMIENYQCHPAIKGEVAV